MESNSTEPQSDNRKSFDSAFYFGADKMEIPSYKDYIFFCDEYGNII